MAPVEAPTPAEEMTKAAQMAQEAQTVQTARTAQAAQMVHAAQMVQEAQLELPKMRAKRTAVGDVRAWTLAVLLLGVIVRARIEPAGVRRETVLDRVCTLTHVRWILFGYNRCSLRVFSAILLFRPGGAWWERSEERGHFSWVFWLERSILITGWVQCRSEVRWALKSRFNTPSTV